MRRIKDLLRLSASGRSRREIALAIGATATVNFPFMATQNCTHSGLAVAAPRSTLLAKSTAVERRIDAWMTSAATESESPAKVAAAGDDLQASQH